MGGKIALPSSRSLSPELRDVANAIAAETMQWNVVEICTPPRDVLATEKQRVFDAYRAGLRYDPLFEYPLAHTLNPDASRRALLALHARLHKFWPIERAELLASHLLESKLIDALATCDLVEALATKDERAIDAALDAIYPAVDQASIDAEKAEYDLCLTVDRSLPGDCGRDGRAYLEQRIVSAREQRMIFEWALECYGLLRRKGEHGIGFAVEVTSGVTSFDVRHRSSIGPVVCIPDAPSTARRVIELVRHEIEAHARQSANGEALFFLGGAFAQNDETLYEGLAMREEYAFVRRHFGPYAHLDPRFFTLAMQWAEEGHGFSAVFAKLVNLYRPLCPGDGDAAMHLAWGTAYRIFRGHVRTSSVRAAMRKDQAYVRGELLDRMLCEAGKGYMNEVGVIALRDLPVLAEFSLSPSSLPYTDLHLGDVLLAAFLEERL